MRKGITAAVATAAVVGGVLAPTAQADVFNLPGIGTCNYPGTSGGGGYGSISHYFCNYPPLLAGMHYHCEWTTVMGVNNGGCDWRNPDNTLAPAPPPEQVFW